MRYRTERGCLVPYLYLWMWISIKTCWLGGHTVIFYLARWPCYLYVFKKRRKIGWLAITFITWVVIRIFIFRKLNFGKFKIEFIGIVNSDSFYLTLVLWLQHSLSRKETENKRVWVTCEATGGDRSHMLEIRRGKWKVTTYTC